MPKFKRGMTGKGMAREIVMTTIATTISIILTFGTAHLIEKWQQKKAGRETAMMVIHDMDENVKLLREAAMDEENYHELTKYVMEHLDQINSFPLDTLQKVVEYLVDDGSEFEFDYSKEKIFHSSQESWKNIDNAQVIDLIQEFYYERHNYEKYFNSHFIYKYAISHDELYEHYLHSPNFDPIENIADFFSQKLQEKRVQLYLSYSIPRQDCYKALANDWQRKSNQCKFIMGITDEEMEEYIAKKERRGQPVTGRKLIGKWKEVASTEDNIEDIEFKKDHSFTHVITKNKYLDIFDGPIIISRNMGGTWKIEGDSLIREYAIGDHYTIDKSHISYSKDKKKMVEEQIANLEERYAQYNEMSKKESSLGRKANAAYIDKSGNKIELKSTIINDKGKEENYSSYMVRQRK